MKLLLEWGEESVILQPSFTYTIGRDIENDIRINFHKVSRTHAQLKFDGNFWTIVDLKSSNGTFQNKKIIENLKITTKTSLRLGGAEGIELILTPLEGNNSKKIKTDELLNRTQTFSKNEFQEITSDSSERIQLTTRTKIGRDLTNDWVVNSVSVSRWHAEIIRNTSLEYELIDLKSFNGTFVNGEIINRRILKNGDFLTFGSVSRRFTQSGLEPVSGIKGSTLSLKNVSFGVKNSQLISNINLKLEPRTLTAIIGPSGAGKSTLLNLISGKLRPDKGEITCNNINIHKNLRISSQLIGLVPQADIVHNKLSTKKALRYGVDLRLPTDIPKNVKAKIVEDIIDKLELKERENLEIEKLSGGQKKRTSIGLELISSPEILLLDEPTSGLDPGLDDHIMKTLRNLANEGQTIALVSHSVENLEYCDNVVLLAKGGTVAYMGHSSTVFKSLGKSSWSEVFRSLASDEGLNISNNDIEINEVPVELKRESVKPRSSYIKQTVTLTKRYARIILGDKFYLSLLGVIPVLTGLLCHLASGPQGFGEGIINKFGIKYNSSAQSLLMLLILGSIFIGLTTSIQEISKENSIRRREQAVGVRSSAYLTSKYLILGIIVIAQELIFTGILLFKRPMPESGLILHSAILELLIISCLLALISVSLGLAVSSLFTASEQAMPALIGITMSQVVLSGALPITGAKILGQIAKVMPSFWATNALAATGNLNKTTLVSNSIKKQNWLHASGTISLSLTAFLVYLLVFYVFALWRLSGKKLIKSAK